MSKIVAKAMKKQKTAMLVFTKLMDEIRNSNEEMVNHLDNLEEERYATRNLLTNNKIILSNMEKMFLIEANEEV